MSLRSRRGSGVLDVLIRLTGLASLASPSALRFATTCTNQRHLVIPGERRSPYILLSRR